MTHFNTRYIYFSALTIGFFFIACTKKTETSGLDSVKNAAITSTATIDAKPAAPPAGAIYPIKSGIIHAEEDAMGMNMTSTKYFDDYGAKVTEETETNMGMGGTKIKNTQVKI